jgi:hypothetical protein
MANSVSLLTVTPCSRPAAGARKYKVTTQIRFGSSSTEPGSEGRSTTGEADFGQGEFAIRIRTTEFVGRNRRNSAEESRESRAKKHLVVLERSEVSRRENG